MKNCTMNRFDSTNSNVRKYVFTWEDAVAETVLYRYGDFMERTVICCSVMSGCPVGCTFCGTGNKFIRNLTTGEIVGQIKDVLNDAMIYEKMDQCKKFQIMFMSMGEPFLNYDNVEEAIRILHKMFPNAQLLISTIAPNVKDNYAYGKFIRLSKEIEKVGLQFSIHRSFDSERNELIPYKNKYTLREIRDYGIMWRMETGRKPYLNYCIDGNNNTVHDYYELIKLFSPVVFCFTFSVVCSSDETMKDAGYRNLDAIRDFEAKYIEDGYDTRVFDPAGQDDIGGGCGQLWYVQQWMKGMRT